MKPKTWLQGIILHWALVASAICLYLLPPLRILLKTVATQPGNGPTRESSAEDVLEMRGVALPDPDDNDDKAALVQVVYKGGMYPCKRIFVPPIADSTFFFLQTDLCFK
jgi:hypothetical protein